MKWFFHGYMASGIARRHIRMTATVTTVESHKMAAMDTSNNRLTDTCSFGLPCTFLTYDIRLWLFDTCQIKLSTDQYHVFISQAQVYSSSRSHALLKLTTDQVLVFYLIVGSCQVNCWKLSRSVWKPVNSNPDFKINQIITVSSLQMFFVYCWCFVYQFCDY